MLMLMILLYLWIVDIMWSLESSISFNCMCVLSKQVQCRNRSCHNIYYCSISVIVYVKCFSMFCQRQKYHLKYMFMLLALIKLIIFIFLWTKTKKRRKSNKRRTNSNETDPLLKIFIYHNSVLPASTKTHY